MSKQKKYHYIYKTTCQVTGKFYVGMHSTDNLDDNYLGSGKILGYSISKHGKENHIKEILVHCSSRDELKKREKEIVNEELLQDPLNINLKYGGEGGGKFWSEEHRIKCQTAGGALGGKAVQLTLSREERVRRAKLAVETAKQNGNFKVPDWNGRKHLESTKSKMSATKKARGSNSGENNSQFGVKRIGINKDGIVKKIIPDQLQRYLDDGWNRGFKSINQG